MRRDSVITRKGSLSCVASGWKAYRFEGGFATGLTSPRYSVTYIYYCVVPRYEELEGVEKLVVAVSKRPGDLLFRLAVVAVRREAVYRPSELPSWRCK